MADRCVIGPPEVGVLASVGRARVRVHRRPRVAILSGGNELVPVDGDISGGRIVASNSYTLSAASRLIGAEPIDLGISRDTAESVEEQFTAALDSDCIVSSAGVSVGDHAPVHNRRVLAVDLQVASLVNDVDLLGPQAQVLGDAVRVHLVVGVRHG